MNDDGGQNGPRKHAMDDYYKSEYNPWNMTAQHQMKEQNQNQILMNKKIMAVTAERDAAIHGRNVAMSEKRLALAERDEAREQRDKAIDERNSAFMERDNAILAFQFSNHYNSTRESHITDAFPISIITADDSKSRTIKRARREKDTSSKESNPARASIKNVFSVGIKIKPELDDQNVGLNLIRYDESTMPAPVCSCTGVQRQCYRWGNGWQSSCCTTTLSVYPLPQMTNERQSRMSGRKMSGNVFSKLLTRLSEAGQDLSVPVDLKDHWARHGTNGYIIIK